MALNKYAVIPAFGYSNWKAPIQHVAAEIDGKCRQAMHTNSKMVIELLTTDVSEFQVGETVYYDWLTNHKVVRVVRGDAK